MQEAFHGENICPKEKAAQTQTAETTFFGNLIGYLSMWIEQN